MLKNYIITAWRNLLRNKIFSIITITGLSIGIASCLLIFLYLRDEVSYDTHWKNAERILKINWEETTDGLTEPYSVVSFGTGPSLKENFPEVEAAVRILPDHSATVSRKGHYFNEENQYSVDSNFFAVFNFELLAGNPATCLRAPNSVVISEAMAERYFGKADPMGESLNYPDGIYKVTGILKNTQNKSHFKPVALLNFNYNSSTAKEMRENMLWLDAYTYVKLKHTASVSGFDKKLKQWSKKVLDPLLRANNVGYAIDLKSQLIQDVHFDNYHRDSFEKADRTYIYIFSWIAVFILLIACFNYMNLSTARASKRSLEIGVRKVSGASRKQLILQFLGESLTVTTIALGIALVLLFLILPAFNALTGKNMQALILLSHGSFWGITFSIILFISVIGGSYPALYLSGFQPVSVLKGKLAGYRKTRGFSRLSLRQLLVISQFAISGCVIICTLLVYSQLSMMKNKDLGFNKDQVLVLKFPWLDSLKTIQAEALKNRLAAESLLKKVATARQPLSVGGNILFRIKQEGKIGQASLNIGGISDDYLDLLNIPLVQGRNFSKDYGTDKNNFILNEAAVKFLRLKNPLGAELSRDEVTYGKVIGVVKDYNYKSPHSKIEPLVFSMTDLGYFVFIKISPQAISQSIDLISKDWNEFFPHDPITYFYLDERFNKQYKSDDTMLTLLSVFAALSILISCMGLFGLAAFITEQRAKEIGIRKVVGASVAHIVYSISKDFLILVLVAIFIASPIACYFINRWLQHFAYKIHISAWIFIATGAFTLLIAFLTMSWQAIGAATANPVKSLRSE